MLISWAKGLPPLVGQNTLRMSSPIPVIAIDGPTASGKGTIASLVAARLGFHYLESGSLYRLVALSGGEPVGAAKGLDVAFREGRIFLKEQDVTDKLRDEAVGNRASEIASNQAVR